MLDAQLPAPQAVPVEPPVESPAPVDPVLAWWGGLTDAERGAWGDKAGPIARVGTRMRIRTPEEVTRAAYALFQATEEAAQAEKHAAKARQKTPRASARRRASVKSS